MCLICEELKKSTMNPWEARRNLREVKETLSEEHLKEVEDYLDELERDYFQFEGGD